MGFASTRRAASESQRKINLLVTVALILIPAAAFAGGPAITPAPSIPDTAEPMKEMGQLKDTKFLAKYDIAHIGQRDIGHGFNLYSQKREHELGEGLAAEFDRTTKLVNDPVVVDYVNRLAQKIVANSDAEIPFTVKVIDSGNIPRAYGLPGGFLYVDTALIVAADGEAELAAVMAHEIAHVAARHATRAISRKRMYSVANSVGMLAGPAGFAIENAGGLAGPLSQKKFARDSEYEADLLAIEYAYSAGYDPQSLMDALEKLHAMEVQRKPDLSKVPGYRLTSWLPFHSRIARGFASYPMTEERIQRLESEIPAFLPGRRDYILDTDEFDEVRNRLLAAQTPTLRRHAGDEDNKGPVLRRTMDENVDLPDANLAGINRLSGNAFKH